MCDVNPFSPVTLMPFSQDMEEGEEDTVKRELADLMRSDVTGVVVLYTPWLCPQPSSGRKAAQYLP